MKALLGPAGASEPSSIEGLSEGTGEVGRNFIDGVIRGRPDVPFAPRLNGLPLPESDARIVKVTKLRAKDLSKTRSRWWDWRRIGKFSIGLELVYSKSSIGDLGVLEKRYVLTLLTGCMYSSREMCLPCGGFPLGNLTSHPF